MALPRGVSGNPSGKAHEKPVTDAIRLAAMRKDRKGKIAVHRMANKIMQEAIKGEAWACNYVADRLEGRPMQPVSQDVTHSFSEVFIGILRAVSNQRIPERLTIDGTVNGQGEAASLAGPGETIPAE